MKEARARTKHQIMPSDADINRREFIKMSSVITLSAGVVGPSAYGAPGVTEAEVAEKYARLIPAEIGRAHV